MDNNTVNNQIVSKASVYVLVAAAHTHGTSFVLRTESEENNTVGRRYHCFVQWYKEIIDHNTNIIGVC